MASTGFVTDAFDGRTHRGLVLMARSGIENDEKCRISAEDRRMHRIQFAISPFHYRIIYRVVRATQRVGKHPATCGRVALSFAAKSADDP